MEKMQELRFDNYIVNGTNLYAYREALRFSHSCKKDQIAIVGPTSAGKSHLINAIVNEYLDFFPNNSYVICSSSDLNTLLEDETGIKDYFYYKNLVVLEDVDCINESDSLLLESTINKISQQCEKLVVTYTNRSKVPAVFNNDFGHYFIQCPNHDIYNQYLEERIYNDNLILSNNSKNYILSKFCNDFRQLISAINKIEFKTENVIPAGTKIPIADIRKILED